MALYSTLNDKSLQSPVVYMLQRSKIHPMTSASLIASEDLHANSDDLCYGLMTMGKTCSNLMKQQIQNGRMLRTHHDDNFRNVTQLK